MADSGTVRTQVSQAVDEEVDRGAECTIAYLTCPQDGAKGFLGALLVTDERTRPLHFAYVQPVRPTAIQRIVYGGTLAEHVKIDVIASKLLKEKVSLKPNVVFVDSADLLAVRRVAGVPTAVLVRVDQAQGNLAQIHYNTGEHHSDEECIGKIVASLEQSVDILDPFKRMQEALKEVLRGERT